MLISPNAHFIAAAIDNFVIRSEGIRCSGGIPSRQVNNNVHLEIRHYVYADNLITVLISRRIGINVGYDITTAQISL